jgi:CYTH domain-containing protein
LGLGCNTNQPNPCRVTGLIGTFVTKVRSQILFCGFNFERDVFDTIGLGLIVVDVFDIVAL